MRSTWHFGARVMNPVASGLIHKSCEKGNDPKGNVCRVSAESEQRVSELLHTKGTWWHGDTAVLYHANSAKDIYVRQPHIDRMRMAFQSMLSVCLVRGFLRVYLDTSKVRFLLAAEYL